MQSDSSKAILIPVPGLVSLVVLCLFLGCSEPATTKPVPADEIEFSTSIDGTTWHLGRDGNLYRELNASAWTLENKVFDPDEIRNSYVTENEVTYRISPDDGRRFATRNEIQESFEDLDEGITGLKQLLDEKRLLWGALTLQSGKTPEVADYVELRRAKLAGERDFADCRVEPSRVQVHGGESSVRFSVPARPDDLITCKASISCPLVYFRNGDDFWFEAAFYIEDSLPMTLVDLETEFVSEHPGIRLRLYPPGTLGAELKALNKPQFRQPNDQAVQFPLNQWVVVKVHYHLSPTDGRIEIWQDGIQVLDSIGPTLPYPSAIYNSLEVGISSHHDSEHGSIVYIDDLKISSQP